MADYQINEQVIGLLLARLERISADSYWAHKASGIRGSLLSLAEKIESGKPQNQAHIQNLLKCGYQILARAARGE